MPRHLRPSTERPPSPVVSTALPDHLVATPLAKGLRRLGVGTVPFSIASLAVLVALSVFVVSSPSSIPGLGVPDQLASVDHDEETAVTAPPTRGDKRATSTTATPTSAPVVTVPPTTTSSPRPRRTTTTTPRAPTTTERTVAEGNLVSLPVSVRPVRCEDFKLQPEAQAAFDADRAGRSGLDGDGDGLACEQLPGRTANQLPELASRRIPTATFLKRPPTRLFGVHTPNAPFANSELEAFSTAAGKSPNTALLFQNLSQEFPESAVATSWRRGMMPMVSFEPIIHNSTEGQPTLADLADGSWDEYFTRWATSAKAFNHPIALRFGHEMNGNWYPWSDGRFGNAPGDFVDAWRHIHDLFTAAGADNVIWVWSINRIDNLPDKTIDRVYPGDQYVDWVGMSGYLREVTDGVTPDFDFTFGATLEAIEELAPSKLVMLTEVGAGTTETHRVAWLRSFFQGLLDHPEIIGFNWFNDFKNGGDWRIQYSAATSEAFAAGVADSRFGDIAPRLPA